MVAKAREKNSQLLPKFGNNGSGNLRSCPGFHHDTGQDSGSQDANDSSHHALTTLDNNGDGSREASPANQAAYYRSQQKGIGGIKFHQNEDNG